MGSDESYLKVSMGSDGQSHKTVSTNHNLSKTKRRAEAVSNRGPSAYQPNALPLGQTGSLRVSGQLRGNKECLFSGVTKSGRVWRRVPESDARSVPSTYSHVLHASRIASFQHIAPCLTIRSPHRQTGQADPVV